jgi:Zn-dependent M28 family amino/carboxypeptidase
MKCNLSVSHMPSKSYPLPVIIFILLVVSSFSCHQKVKAPVKEEAGKTEASLPVPSFNADSALSFVKHQTDFGPRVPASKAYVECETYLVGKLKQYTANIEVQGFKSRIYNGTTLTGKNIIASFSPEKKARIMLCAHWDSRPFADHDPDPAKRNKPISGANDGASGVGVLLEVARLLKNSQPAIGIDIIFFDLEDYGPPEDEQKESKNEYWGLGSQYWSMNPHRPDYRARFVILLDMVGAANATFRQEGFSLSYAPDKVHEVWDVARRLGYQDYFLDEKGSYINDDHYFINDLSKIPAIDIIDLQPSSSNGSFNEYWHTTSDTFDKIEKETLRVVGQTITTVIFGEK